MNLLISLIVFKWDLLRTMRLEYDDLMDLWSMYWLECRKLDGIRGIELSM